MNSFVKAANGQSLVISVVIIAWISGQPWWMVAFTTGLAPVSARRLPRDKLAS
jgi:hypothetical protein